MKFSNNTCTRLLLVTLGLSFTGFYANATSPAKVSHMNAIDVVSTSYSANDHQFEAITKMFPAPQVGMTQHILTLPPLANEQDYKIEIAIGRTEQVDCNKHGLSGSIDQHTVKGWGYNYYQVDKLAKGPSTMMACFDKAKTSAFLTLAEKLTLDYDSRLPKVFYLPEGAQLRYRVWQTLSDYHYSEAK